MEQEHKQLVIGILAHVDSGKTTLSEAMLYGTGTIRKLGRVDHKDAFLDTDALEKARGITIFSKQALFTAGNTDFTLLDTPGHVDFSTETERTLQVLDYAVLVISGTDGVQSHTETLWRLLRRYHIPTFVFINKMDLPGADRAALLADACVQIVDAMSAAQSACAVPGASSVSNDGYSVTFASGALSERLAAEAQSILSNALGSDPHGLLYRGCF